LGDDPTAGHLLDLLADRVEVLRVPTTSTTAVKTRLRAGNHPIARFDTGGRSGVIGELPLAVASLVRDAQAVLVADYGYGFAAQPKLRSLLKKRQGALVWDPHRRGPVPVAGASLATPNLAEAAAACGSISGRGLSRIRRQ